jgi:hypothetical protein
VRRGVMPCLLRPLRPACSSPACQPASPLRRHECLLLAVASPCQHGGRLAPLLLTPAMCISFQACWPGRPLLQTPSSPPPALPCSSSHLPACLQPRRGQPRRRLLCRLPDTPRAGVPSHCARAVCLLL